MVIEPVFCDGKWFLLKLDAKKYRLAEGKDMSAERKDRVC